MKKLEFQKYFYILLFGLWKMYKLDIFEGKFTNLYLYIIVLIFFYSFTFSYRINSKEALENSNIDSRGLFLFEGFFVFLTRFFQQMCLLIMDTHLKFALYRQTSFKFMFLSIKFH